MVPEEAQYRLSIKILHYALPALITLYFLISTSVSICTLQTRASPAKDRYVNKSVMILLGCLLLTTYFLEAGALVTASFSNSYWMASKDYISYLLLCVSVYGLQFVLIAETEFPIWYTFYGSWMIGVVFEVTLLILANVRRGPPTLLHFVLIVTKVGRISILLILPFIYLRIRCSKRAGDEDAERQALLKPATKSKRNRANGSKYGSTEAAAENSADESDDSYDETHDRGGARVKARLDRDGSWWSYLKGFKIFIPLVWPANSKSMQARIFLVGLCLLANNAFHVLMPWQFGVMIDSVTRSTEGAYQNVWVNVILYAVMIFVSTTCIDVLRTWFWLPVEQRAIHTLNTAAHAHIMSLSCEFHDSQNTSDVIQALHGTRGMVGLLEITCFQIAPLLVDIAAAYAFLWSFAGPLMGVIMVITTVTYLYLTFKMIAIRTQQRRRYVKYFRKEWTVSHASVEGWTTASLFNMLGYESRRYNTVVDKLLRYERRYRFGYQAVGASQSALMSCGFLATLLLATYQCQYEGKSIGNFSTMIMYWGQLKSPLSSLSSLYNTINSNLIEAERMLELFLTKPVVADPPSAKDLNFSEGLISFNDVCFAYDKVKPTLKHINFVVPPGKTYALVGETGGGKSTILKLLNRFYDVDEGGISIDGQDIRQVTLDSLRSRFGVVPQEPMLFNESIMANVRYARITATDEEVFAACRAAVIHDKILTFPKGYTSKVGPRGVKLSGGEKQRIAIARAFLKQPDIVLLDEATSAVDTETETYIHEGLRRLCKDRTTVVIAHRLSTVMRADCIMVIMDGSIVEMGDHATLIKQEGKYYDLWSKQVFHEPKSELEESTGQKSMVATKSSNGAHVNGTTHEPSRATGSPVPETLQAKLDVVSEAHKSSTDSAVKSFEGSDSKPKPKDERAKLKAEAPEFIPLRSSSKRASKTDIRESSRGNVAHKRHVRSLSTKDDSTASSSSLTYSGSPRRGSSRPNTAKFHSYHEHCGQSVNLKPNNFHTQSEVNLRVPNISPRIPPVLALSSHEVATQHAQPSFQSAYQLHCHDEHQDDTRDGNKDESKTSALLNFTSPSTEMMRHESQIPLLTTKGSTPSRPKHQRSRLSRRQMTKSEPAGRMHRSGDGIDEADPSTCLDHDSVTEVTEVAQHRQVSAPSAPPSGLHDTRNHRPRRTRTRHWRLRNKPAERFWSSKNNTSSSGPLGSTSTSTDEHVTAPFPSPAAEIQATVPVVRFALDC